MDELIDEQMITKARSKKRAWEIRSNRWTSKLTSK
jgi:hypothetical protein